MCTYTHKYCAFRILWNSWPHFCQSNRLKQNVSNECILGFVASLHTKQLHQKYQAARHGKITWWNRVTRKWWVNMTKYMITLWPMLSHIPYLYHPQHVIRSNYSRFCNSITIFRLRATTRQMLALVVLKACRHAQLNAPLWLYFCTSCFLELQNLPKAPNLLDIPT
jgi:hypothetical protein